MATHRKADKKDAFRLKGLVWIDRGESTFLGQGRVVLLERIKEFGSITEAAKSMEMSYKHAWDLVDSMNNQAKEPLVEKATGGKGGGGARLTEAGEKAISMYWEFHRDLTLFLEREEEKFKLK